MGVKIDSRKVRAGEKWIFRKITNMTAGARPLRWVGSYTQLNTDVVCILHLVNT